MSPVSQPFQFLLAAVAGWMHQQQRDVNEYLQTENRVLREQLAAHGVRFTDDQRVRLAAKAKILGRRALRRSAPSSPRMRCSPGIGGSSPAASGAHPDGPT